MKHVTMLLLLVLCAGQVLAQETVVPAQSNRAVGELLNEDGTLNTDAGYSGTVNTAGYQMVLGPKGEPKFKLMSGSANEWDDAFFLPGVDGSQVNAVAVDGSGNVYIGGLFSAVNGVPANNIAKWNGSAWSALGSNGNGLNTFVYAITMSGDSLFVGGQFTTANVGGTEVTANRIAVWNGSAWSSVGSAGGNGLNNTVNAIAVSGTDVYVGGEFTIANSGASEVTAYRLALWDGSAWNAIGSGSGNGVNNFVNAIFVSGTDVYVGGDFDSVNVGETMPASRIAKWNGSSWDSLGSNGVGNSVLAIAVSGSDVYVGGVFTTANSGSVAANYIAKWNGSVWSELGSDGNGVNTGNVYAIVISGGNVYIGGGFTEANSGGTFIPANRVAVWNGSAWGSLGSGGGEGASALVRALARSGSDLYIGGLFTTTNVGGTTVTAGRIAKWNGSAWSALGGGVGNGVNGTINAVAVSGSNVYIGGDFTAVYASGVEISANRIAKWDGSTWSALSSGMNSTVYSIAVGGSDVYAGGSFTTPANKIARWDGDSWENLGTNSGAPSIRAIAVSGSDVYAGGLGSGAFAGTTAASDRIARWDGSAWNEMATGLLGTVYAIAVVGTDVYAGGSFSERIKKWNGGSWVSVGSGGVGADGTVYSLAVADSILYVGGAFSNVNVGAAVSANRIAKWDGSSWSKVGSDGNGMDGDVTALAVSGSYVYAGGSFTTANVGGTTVTANRVAWWDGSEWNAVGSGGGNGVNSTVNSIAVAGSDLYVGGLFTFANSGASPPEGASRFAKWYSNYATSPAAAASGPVRSGGDGVLFSGTSVTVGLTAGDTGEFNVYRYTDGPVNVSGITGNVSSYRWIIQQMGADTGLVGTVDFTTETIPDNGIGDGNNVTVYYRPTPGTGAFTALSTVYTTGVLTADVTAFGEFAFGSAVEPLPVQMVSFSAAATRDGAELHWMTATEVNTAGFQIERRSATDPNTPAKVSDYTAVGFVEGSGTSTSTKEYVYVDKDLAPGRYVYRIKQIDLDGSSTYSETVEVSVGLAPLVFHLGQNYPNPFNPSTTVEFTIPADGRATLKVYNVLGQEMATLLDENLTAGVFHRAQWNAAGVPSGTYIARLTHQAADGKSSQAPLTKKLVLVK